MVFWGTIAANPAEISGFILKNLRFGLTLAINVFVL